MVWAKYPGLGGHWPAKVSDREHNQYLVTLLTIPAEYAVKLQLQTILSVSTVIKVNRSYSSHLLSK